MKRQCIVTFGPAKNSSRSRMAPLLNRNALPLLIVISSLLCCGNSADLNTVLAQRDQILAQEDQRLLGGSLTLNSMEKLVNDGLMALKTSEYDLSFDTADFVPATHFFQAKAAMLESKVYQFIRKMPKGAALHTHDIAITPIDFLVNDASYRPDLYVCSPTVDPIFFRFAPSPPADMSDCKWTLVATRRTQEGAVQFDAWLRSKLSLYTPNPEEAYPNINAVWTAFENTLIAASGIISYAPVFTDYFYQGLQFFYDDNVQYIEIRTTIPEVYLLNGTQLDEVQVTSLYEDTFIRFKRDHPDFSGAKIIFAPLRRVDTGTLKRYVTLASQLKVSDCVFTSVVIERVGDNAIDWSATNTDPHRQQAQFPNSVAGFDLVGQEDLGPPLKDFLGELINGSTSDPDLRYFFHAGETDWQGTSVDENMIDAILLNATRIGHGFAIAKHPVIKELARANNVPVEICPISNQVLALVADLRDHPAAGLFSDDFPLVISADDPASWEAIGLSSDFYMAFMGLAGRKGDLRTLKKLALNSIMYSAMGTDEKNAAMIEWQKRWDAFIVGAYEDKRTLHNSAF